MRGFNDVYAAGRGPSSGWCADKRDSECFCVPIKGFTPDGKAFTSVLRFHVPEPFRVDVESKMKTILTERAQCFTDAHGATAAKPMCADKVTGPADLTASKYLG